MMVSSSNRVSISETPLRGPGGRAPLLQTPKDMSSKALEMIVSIVFLHLENMEGALLLSYFQRKKSCLEKFMCGFQKICKNAR
jgi:hypothetical protein